MNSSVRGGRTLSKKPTLKPDSIKKKKDDDDGNNVIHDDRKLYIRPSDQLELSEDKLNEEITTILTANNPNAPRNIARFSYKERAYKFDPAVEQVAFHFSADGYMIHKESEEAKKQTALLANAKKADKPKDTGETGGDDTDAQGRPLRNQFNYAERATQTYHNQSKERETSTEPPPSTNFSATATQWEMFDAYVEDIERNRNAKEKGGAKEKKEDDKGGRDKKDKGEKAGEKHGADEVIYSSAMERSLKIMERMINQNNYEELTMDYKYWDDASDQYKEEGSLLPLWKFYNDKQKKKHVTAVAWNHHYHDLFAVGYGSYDFMKQVPGAVCCYTLKNACNYPESSSPEYSFTTETGVTCLDFHPQYHSLLAVGCYDGSVMVFDVRSKTNKPLFQSTAKTGKHTDPVWQVHWQEEDLAKNLNFFSISSDGRVTLWTLSKNELQYTDVLQLKLESSTTVPSVAGNSRNEEEDQTALSGLAGGCCFDFNAFSEHLFVVGTEEGKIHKCSKAYNSQYLKTYDGHFMNVYSVKWNPYHPKVFISCSADWTVKIWDHDNNAPLMTFDLNNAVGDVAWAPYASTTFAAVTDDGKVHVFDLKESKHEVLCEQVITTKSKLTHVSFNPRTPILLVGDDKGNVMALKLSPNLRKTAQPPKDNQKQNMPKAPNATQTDGANKTDLEKAALEKVLGLADNKSAE